MSSKNLVDVKKVIESHAYVTSLKDLERKGKTKLKVIKAEEISNLISRAVDKVVADHSTSLANQEKAKIVEKSKKEFQKFLKERQEEQKKAAQQDDRIREYEQKLAEANGELKILREKTKDLERKEGLLQAKEERVHSLETQLSDQKRQTDSLRNQLESEKDETRNVRDSYISQLGELKDLIKDRGPDERMLQEQKESREKYEMQIKLLQGELRNVRESVNYSDDFSSLLSEVKNMKSSLGEMEKDRTAKVDEKFFTEQLAPLLNKEDKINSRIEKLFADKMDKLSQKISQKIQNLSVMDGKIVDEKDSVEAAKLVLENLFNEEVSLESNMENIGVKEQTGTGILGNLEKLKALRNAYGKKEEEEEAG